MPLRLSWKSATFFFTTDRNWKLKFLEGGLWMLFPFIGWPIALGYRTVLINNLRQATHPILPSWKNHRLAIYWAGWKAIGVIFCYLLPATFWFWGRLYYAGFPPLYPWLAIISAFLFLLILAPLFLPCMVVLLHFQFGDRYFSAPQALAFILFYSLIVFFIPAGFLQVSRTGRYLSAFDLHASFRTLFANFQIYCEAWVYSSLISLIGHFCFPFSPWGVFWAYQSIVYSFNEILYLSTMPEDLAFKENSFFKCMKERA